MHAFDHVLQALERIFPSSPYQNIHLDILKFCIYVGIMRVVLLLPIERLRKILFVVINIAALVEVYRAKGVGRLSAAVYVLIVIGFYLLARSFAFDRKWPIASLAPILALVMVRYLLTSALVNSDCLMGFSYMAFRLSQLVVIVRNRIVPMPNLLDYLSFAFFLPTMFVGPISSYSTFQSSVSQPNRSITPVGVCVSRMLVGGCKFLFLANVFDRLSFKALLLDGYPHQPIDLAIASVAYFLTLYCNFSGFCDVAIGASGLLGIKVEENFNAPYAARNIKDYWNRWHITLSSFMRDMFFMPVSKAIMAKLPQSQSNTAIAVTLAMVFILIGIWHGAELNYFAFGVMNALGIVGNFYYGLFLKKRLTKEQLRWYNGNRYVHAVCVVVNFVFVCATLFLFANSIEQMKSIIHAIW